MDYGGWNSISIYHIIRERGERGLREEREIMVRRIEIPTILYNLY
jgi:hypothetical protein